MTILKDVGRELWSMFVADARLTLALLALVAATGGAMGAGLVGAPLAAAGLVTGTVAVLLAAVAAAARRR